MFGSLLQFEHGENCHRPTECPLADARPARDLRGLRSTISVRSCGLILFATDLPLERMTQPGSRGPGEPARERSRRFDRSVTIILSLAEHLSSFVGHWHFADPRAELPALIELAPSWGEEPIDLRSTVGR